MAEVKGKTPKAAKPETEQVAAAPVVVPVESAAATALPTDPVAPVSPVTPSLEWAAGAESLHPFALGVSADLSQSMRLGEPGSEFWSFYGRTCQAAIDVLQERCRQVEGEGYTAELDDAYTDYQLPRAAICYGIKAAGLPDHLERLYWPFRARDLKPANRRGRLVKAAALLLAEIERLDRAENPTD